MKLSFRCLLSLVVGLSVIGGTIVSVAMYGFADDITVGWFSGAVIYGLIEMLISSYMGIPCIKKQAGNRKDGKKSSGSVQAAPTGGWASHGAGRALRRRHMHSYRATECVEVLVA